MRGHTTLTLRVNSSSSTSVNDHRLNDTPERQTLLENQRKESVCEVFVDVQIWGSGGRRTEDGGQRNRSDPVDGDPQVWVEP